MIELIIGIIAVAFAIWAIVDVLRSNFKMNKRVLWLAIVILFPIIGPLVYYIKGRN